MSELYYFSPEQAEIARRTNLVELLRSQGEQLKPSGSEYEWLCQGQKVTIRRNLWYHQYEQAGGNAVDFAMFALLTAIPLVTHMYNLNHIKSKTVGDGQHGTARWATKSEIRKTYRHVSFTPEQWRREAASGKEPTVAGTNKPLPQGIVVGCTGGKHSTTAMIDTGDVHALMIGAAGVGKTAYWLYPCIEYACASGMSFLSTDTKGDIMRNYGNIAKGYGYHISVIDLRNPTRSNGNNYTKARTGFRR